MNKHATILTFLLLAGYGWGQLPETHPHSEHETEEHEHEEEHETEVHDEEHEHGEHEEERLKISAEVQQELGILMAEAHGGAMVKTAIFPAEIKLNRDQAATVSPRYASIVREVVAEIGDVVKKGDTLAVLENRKTLATYPLSAPLDGVVIAKHLAAGETADSDAELYQVANLQSVWADISIFPQYQHVIKKGMTVEFIAHDGHQASGTVKYISPIVSHETRTFTARCILQKAAPDFTPGAFVRAQLAVQSTEARIRVPREAVQMIEGEPVVFIPEEDGFEARPVETGLSNDRFIEILQGLEPGASYVSAGAFALKAELMTSGMDPHAGHNH